MFREAPKFLIDESAIDLIILTPNHKPHIDCKDKFGKDSQCLQNFIDKRALINQNTHLGTTYLITYKKKIIGYITVATSNIHKDKIFKNARPSTRDGAFYPALVILDFCIDKKSRGKTFGDSVLFWCSGLARDISERVGCRYIVLYTKDPDAIGFYEKHSYQIAEGNQGETKLMYVDVFPEIKKITIFKKN